MDKISSIEECFLKFFIIRLFLDGLCYNEKRDKALGPIPPSLKLKSDMRISTYQQYQRRIR